MHQLLALPHGMFGVAMELALVVHDHVEVTFEEVEGLDGSTIEGHQIAFVTCFLHHRDLLR
jgi:hypothetical protein